MASFNSQSPLKQAVQREYNIILFGETGSGKSTLINYLTNYFQNGTLENLKIAIPTKHYEATEGLKHHEDNVQDTSKSQTRACTVYTFRKQGTVYNFIDTPGLSDTEGVAQDESNIQQIMGAAEQSGVLTAIILVINGTQTRATVTLCRTLCLLRSSIPDVLLQNLVVVLTNCSFTTVNFNLAHLEPWTVPESNVFHMNNCAFSRPVSQWTKNERMKQNLEREWKCSMEAIEELIQNLKQLGGKATEAFKQMRINRERIKSQLQNILLDVTKCQDLQNELDMVKTTQQNIATDIKKYSDYKRTKQVEYTELVKSEHGNSFCTECSTPCEEVSSMYRTVKSIPICRDVVSLFEYMLKLPTCHCGHSAFDHYVNNARPVKKTKTVEEILGDVKNAYDLSTKKNEEIQSEIGNLNTDIAALKCALDAMQEEILECCYQLKKLCSQFNFVDELQGVIGVMERDTRTLTSTMVRADAEKRIRSIKHVIDTLSSAGKSG
ncbi:uncharacterized protein LOC115267201 [Aedes albopictus]|uniref:G domain-containing protein n=1 Tax=Aedes albopictus TaxID=7160 RepID=A0ABM1ZK91_AEDAL|nr:uncharacterized protein LOC115267201 [Aedes albopictus]